MDSASLANAFNAALVALNKNGTLATLQHKWLGVATAMPAEMPTPNY